MNLFGLIDFYNGLEKIKEVGGCIEASSLTLSDGTTFSNPVITRVDYAGHRIYSLGFMDDAGVVRVVNVDQISVVLSPEHKKIADLNNHAYQTWAREQKRARIRRLLEISEGAKLTSYEKELRTLLDDIGLQSVEEFAGGEL
jgi:hypothetical protein